MPARAFRLAEAKAAEIIKTMEQRVTTMESQLHAKVKEVEEMGLEEDVIKKKEEEVAAMASRVKELEEKSLTSPTP